MRSKIIPTTRDQYAHVKFYVTCTSHGLVLFLFSSPCCLSYTTLANIVNINAHSNDHTKKLERYPTSNLCLSEITLAISINLIQRIQTKQQHKQKFENTQNFTHQNNNIMRQLIKQQHMTHKQNNPRQRIIRKYNNPRKKTNVENI